MLGHQGEAHVDQFKRQLEQARSNGSVTASCQLVLGNGNGNGSNGEVCL